MDKSKICVSFILLFSFMLSSHVLAHELPQTSLTEPSFDSTTQTVIGADIGFPSPPDVELIHWPVQEVVGKSDLSKDIIEADKLGLENRKLYWNIGIGGGDSRGSNGGGNPSVGGIGGIGGIGNGGIGNGGWGGDYISVEKQENQHSHKDKGNVVKNPKPTSSQNLEMDRSGVSSMFSLRHSVRHGYTIPTLKEKENQHYDLERKRIGDSSMHRFSQRHGYKTTSSEETGKSDLSKDVAEVDKSGLENRKWNWKIDIGGGDRRGSTGGIGNIGGIGDGGFGNGGWGGDFISTGTTKLQRCKYNEAQNMKKFSEFDRESFRESQATKKFGTKNGDKIYYSVPRMEDIGEDKKN
uniref:Nodulin-45 n=2 Tax=Lupinus angustifolius TaxID=3871 RepID=Q43878_LUPAN|nr:nodulin-45 [Lupinus angustifolius]